MTRMAGQLDQMNEAQALQLQALLDAAGLQVVQPYVRRKPNRGAVGSRAMLLPEMLELVTR